MIDTDTQMVVTLLSAEELQMQALMRHPGSEEMKVQVQAKQAFYTGELVEGGEEGRLSETLRVKAGLSRVVVLKNAVAVRPEGTRRHKLLVIDGADVLSIGIPDDEADAAEVERLRREAQERGRLVSRSS